MKVFFLNITVVCSEPFSKTSYHVKTSQLIFKPNLRCYVWCVLSFNYGRNNFFSPKKNLKKPAKEQLNFSNYIFCCMWKTKWLIIIYFSIIILKITLLGHSRNYMPSILVACSAKCFATQILVTAKLNERLLN